MNVVGEARLFIDLKQTLASDLDYKGVFALIKIGFLQSSFYEVMWSSLPMTATVKPNRYHVSMLKTNKNQA